MGKYRILVLSLVIGLSLPSFASKPVGDTSRMADGVVMVFDELGHEVPFPKGAIIIFPWDSIEGYWSATIREIPGIFLFKIDFSDIAHKKLKVHYYDQSRTHVLAEGVGIIDEEGKIIRANLEGPNVSVAFVVSAYRLKESGYERTEIVTNIILKSPSGKIDGNNYVIRKVKP